ncbi:MAG: hypothetical protein PHD56_07840 [Anaerostipes sp.]|nr:hypothetical protein [Anaerostipes sp.]
MNLLIKRLGRSEITGAIYKSEAAQYPIVVRTRRCANSIKEQAERMGRLIPEPVVVEELSDSIMIVPKHILIYGYETVIELSKYLGTMR